MSPKRLVLLSLLAVACRDDGVVVHAEPPLVSIFEPSDGSVFYEDQQIEFRAQLDVVDGTPLDDLTHRWVSGNVTLCEEVFAPSDGIALCVTQFPEAGEFSVTVTAKSPFNERATDTVAIIVEYNNPPGIELVSPGQDSVYQDASFIVFEARVWDEEDEPDQLLVTLESSIDGDLGVKPNATTSGDWTDAVSDLSDGTHLLTITVEDSAGKTAQDTITLRAGNSAPGFESVSVEPNPIYTLDDAECAAAGWLDGEGDPERYTFRWFHNGTENTGETSGFFPYSNTVKGDQLQCEATAYDDFEIGEALTSPTVTVRNTPPSDPAVAITPGTPEPEDGLVCGVTTSSKDDDQDPVSYEYTWYQNGTVVGALTGAGVDYSYTEHGDTWKCEVRAWDGEEYSNVVSDQVDVEDLTAPDAPSISPLDEYRNDEAITLAGSCEADCDLTFYFSDSTGSWTETDTCGGGNTFSYTTSVTRGYETDVYATCEDAAGNVSGASNTVTTEACDPEDVNESLGGDTFATAIGGWGTLTDNFTNTVTIKGNVLSSSDTDWYSVTATNPDSGTNNDNPFNLKVDLVAGSSIYNFSVYKGSSSSKITCSTSTYQEFDYYQYDNADGNHAQPVDTSNCGSGASYNTCDDFGDTWYVEVNRNSNAAGSCQHYELEITNGDTP